MAHRSAENSYSLGVGKAVNSLTKEANPTVGSWKERNPGMVTTTHYLAHLGRHVSWLQVLPLLGENWIRRLRDTLLPKQFPCPVCVVDAAPPPLATIYADRTLGGEWIHCPTCGFGGDIIELVATKWKLDPITTVRELASRGVGPPADHLGQSTLQAYAANLDYRKSVRQLWCDAQEALVRHEAPGIRDLAHRLGFLTDTIHSEWLNRGGRFIGSTDTPTLHRLLQPLQSQPRSEMTSRGVYLHPRSNNDWLGSGNGVLPDVIVLPLYDLPGRISSLLIVGEGKREGSIRVLCKRLKTDRNTATTENGLWMFDNLLGGTEPGFHTTFVFDDPLLAMQLQIEHLRISSSPLPIVAMFCNDKFRPQHVWEQNPPKHYTFWSPKIHAGLLRQAKLAEGHVSMYEADRAACLRELEPLPPHVWLHGLQRRSKHWYRGLETCLQRMPDEEAKALALSLELNISERERYLEQVSPIGATRFKELVPDLARKSCLYRGRTVQETDGGWIHKGPGTLVLNGQLRILTLIRIPGPDQFSVGQRFWRGEFIDIDGDRHTFIVRAYYDPNQDRSTRELIDQLEEKGVQVEVQKGWAAAIWDIAGMFHKPELKRGDCRVGWHDSECCFMFPEFAIYADGSTEAHDTVVERHAPCQGIPIPVPLYPSEIDALGTNRESVRLIWATAAYTAYAMLAPFQRLPPMGLLLDGEHAATAAGWLGELLRLQQRRRGLSEKARIFSERVRRTYRRHDWPMIADRLDKKKVTLRSLFKGGCDGPLIVPAEWTSVRSAMTHPGWALFEVKEPQETSPVPSNAGEKLVVLYLQDVLERQVPFTRTQIGSVAAFLEDMSKWFKNLGGKPAVVLAAAKAVTQSDLAPAHEWALEIVRRFVFADQRNPSRCHGEPIATFPDDNAEPRCVWISPQRLRQRLEVHHAPCLNSDAVVRSLYQSDIWFREDERDGEIGWSFERAWWDRNLRLWQEMHDGAKRICTA